MSFVGVFLFIFVVSCKISVNFGEMVVAVSLLMVSDVEIGVVMDACMHISPEVIAFP